MTDFEWGGGGGLQKPNIYQQLVWREFDFYTHYIAWYFRYSSVCIHKKRKCIVSNCIRILKIWNYYFDNVGGGGPLPHLH